MNITPLVINDRYSRLLVGRDRRLSFQLEGILRDVILADPSDRGVDLAVAKIFPTYKPATHRWEQMPSSNTHWLTYKTEATVDQPSQILHLNLRDGELRVDGHPIGGLPREIRGCLECREIFRDVRTLVFLILINVPDYCLQQGFFVIPSNLPGMDFTTVAVTSKHKVDISLVHNMITVTQTHAASLFTAIR